MVFAEPQKSPHSLLEWIMHDKAQTKVDNVTHSITYSHLKTIPFATFAKSTLQTG